MYKRILVLSFFLMGTALLFQNCGRVTFQSSPSLVTAKDSPTDVVNNPPPILDPTPAPGPTPIIDPTPVPSPSPSPSATPLPSPSPTPSNPGNGNPGNPGGNNPGDNGGSGDVVECALGSAAQKIALSSGSLFNQHSNAADSRACMSSNACLNLVNAYATVRNCSLAKGAATSADSGQCTMIFPGSSGTCKHAKVLSDADIANILAGMAK